MNASKTLMRADSRRPSAFARSPDFELDCRTPDCAGVPALKMIMEEARRLGSGQILALRTEFMPTLLCRIMASRGFKHWSESSENGQWTSYFRKDRR